MVIFFVQLISKSGEILHIIYILILIRPTEFADPVETLQPVPFDDDVTPLSTIPIMYSEQPLLSDWPEEFLKKVYRYVHIIRVSRSYRM